MTISLFKPEDIEPEWAKHWRQMPEYICEDIQPVRQLILSFANEDEIQEFSNLLGQRITSKTKSLWFKPQPIGTYRDKSYE